MTVIETFVHARAFTGALHMILAGPAGALPEDWASRLRALADEADPVEEDTALA